MKDLTSPSRKAPAKEDKKTNPWSKEAKYKLQVRTEDGEIVAEGPGCPLPMSERLSIFMFHPPLPKVEEELAKMEDLNYVIVRPAIVYGKGDRYGITPRMVIMLRYGLVLV